MPEPIFQVEIVSPERPLFRGEAASVVAESDEGELGVLPGHAPLVALLGTGLVRVRAEGLRESAERFAVRGGFLQVLGKKVTLLVTQAARREDIDVAKAKASLEKTLESLRHPKSDEEYARLLEDRRWFTAQIKLAGA